MSMSQLPDYFDLLEEHRVRWWEVPQLTCLSLLALGVLALIGLLLLLDSKLRHREKGKTGRQDDR